MNRSTSTQYLYYFVLLYSYYYLERESQNRSQRSIDEPLFSMGSLALTAGLHLQYTRVHTQRIRILVVIQMLLRRICSYYTSARTRTRTRSLRFLKFSPTSTSTHFRHRKAKASPNEYLKSGSKHRRRRQEIHLTLVH